MGRQAGIIGKITSIIGQSLCVCRGVHMYLRIVCTDIAASVWSA